MNIWAILSIIAGACVLILVSLIIIGLKTGSDIDDRMDDICNAKPEKLNENG